MSLRRLGLLILLASGSLGQAVADTTVALLGERGCRSALRCGVRRRRDQGLPRSRDRAHDRRLGPARDGWRKCSAPLTVWILVVLSADR